MEFLEVPLYDDDLIKLATRFVFNLFFMSLVTRLAIAPNLRKREFLFTAVMMNILVFFICFTLKKLQLELGMALGLFAIFGVLRYRTDAIRPKEMTYLFMLIGIAVINALSNKKTSYAELVAVNSVIMFGAITMEYMTRKPKLPHKVAGASKQSIVYDKLELLNPTRVKELHSDLQSRIGLQPVHVEIGNIDLISSTAKLTVYYKGSNESQ